MVSLCGEFIFPLVLVLFAWWNWTKYLFDFFYLVWTVCIGSIGFDYVFGAPRVLGQGAVSLLYFTVVLEFKQTLSLLHLL